MKHYVSIFVALLFLAVCGLPGIGQSLDADVQEQQWKSAWKGKVEEPLQVLTNAQDAILAGDVVALKRILDKYPSYKSVLKKEIGNEYPICIAAANGYNELVKYMVEQDKSVLSMR